MSKYAIKILIDNNAPYVFEDVGLTPYILEADWTVGGKYQDEWQRDGDLTLTLDNSTGVFDPYDTSSPFYEMLDIKRRLQLTINDVVFWSGRIEESRPSLDFKKPVMEIKATQGLQDIKDISLQTFFYQNVGGKTLIDNLIEDNPYIPYDLTYVFIVEYGDVGDELTSDYGAALDNQLLDDYTYAYASDSWNGETSLYEAIENVLRAEQGIAYLGRNNGLHVVPFWYMKTATPAGTEAIDTSAVDAQFQTNDNIINEVVISYYTRELATETVITKVEQAIENGLEYTWKVSSLETEQRRIILGGVTVITGGEYVSVRGVSDDRIRLVGIADTESTTIEIRADIVKIGEKQTAIAESQGSLDRYRARFSERISYELVQSEAMAEAIGARIVTREGFPYVYVESISFVDYHPYEIGDVITLQSARLTQDSPHLVVGEEHKLTTDTIETTYYLIGADAAKIFIVDTSLVSGNDVII
jgi:hypothetical protein